MGSNNGRKDYMFRGILYGTTFRSTKWRSLDPCGLWCVSFSCSIHIFCLLTIATKLLPSYSDITSLLLFFIVYIPCFIMAVWSLYMAWSTDPGAVPRGAIPVPQPDHHQSGTTTTTTTTTFNAHASLVGAAGDNDEEQQQQQQRGGDVLLTSRNTSSTTAKPSPLMMVGDNNTTGTTGTAAAGMATNAATTRRLCRKCNDNYKPVRAHHDSVTNRCIIKFDHYCPWVGNAIGLYNHKHFVLFNLYTLMCCLTSLPIIILTFTKCHDDMYNNNANNADMHRYSSGCQQLLEPSVMGLIICTVLFFIFTICMLGDQYVAITKGVSKIARMQQKRGSKRDYYIHGRDDNNGDSLEPVATEFNEMFGTNGEYPFSRNFRWHWLVPLKVKYPSNMESYILGYRTPEDDHENDEEHNYYYRQQNNTTTTSTQHNGTNLNSNHNSTTTPGSVVVVEQRKVPIKPSSPTKQQRGWNNHSTEGSDCMKAPLVSSPISPPPSSSSHHNNNDDDEEVEQQLGGQQQQQHQPNGGDDGCNDDDDAIAPVSSESGRLSNAGASLREGITTSMSRPSSFILS